LFFEALEIGDVATREDNTIDFSFLVK